LHAKGDYAGALDTAERLMTTVSSEMGEDNAIYASCLNNVALMNKLLGEDDLALDHYTRALHIYQDVSGKKHASYASTLSNIGILYRSMAEKASGMDRLQLVERAEEALSDAHATRSEMDGTSSRGAVSASMNLAMVWRVMDEKERGKRAQECEFRLQSCLDISTAEYGREDALTATILSNYGLFLKESGRYTDARTAYEEALHIRSSTLGDVHPDTIVSMHNLAECLLSLGLESESVAMQEKILQTLGHDMADTHGFGGEDLRNKQQEPSSSDDGSVQRVVAANKAPSAAAATTATADNDDDDDDDDDDGDDRTVVASLDEDGNVLRQDTAPRPVVTYATRPRKKKNKKGP
jgi:tetratricopeptide (TPR) repeat protein